VLAPLGQPGEELHPPRALTRCHSFPPAAVAGDPFTTKTFRANLRAPEAPGNPFPGNEIAGASEGDKEGKRFRDARFLRQTQKKTVLSKKTEEEKRPEGKEQPEPGGESQPVITGASRPLNGALDQNDVKICVRIKNPV
jgi:hypothetical protein